MKKLLCSLFALSAISTAMAQEVNIKLLGTSDVHGRIVPWSYGADVEDKSGSYAQIATYVKDVRKNNKNVVLVEVGDAIQDNQIEVFAKDKKYYKNHPVPKVLNEMNYDIFVLGNHEFNFGMKALDEILKDIKAKKLTANFYHKKNDKRYIDATTIIEKDGVKLGIIGLSTPMSAKFEEDTGNLKDMKFTSPTEEARTQVEKLKAKGVDAIIAVTHMGIDNENNIPDTGMRDVINAVDGIDVVIAGHMHKDVPSETIKNTLITEPHRYGTVVSEVNLTFDINDKKEVKLVKKESKTVPVKALEADKKIVEIYKPYHEKLRELNNVVIGQTANEMVPQETKHGVSAAFSKDTGLSSFINDVEQHYSGADVVTFSFDHQKARMDKGDIKKKDIIFNYRYAGGDVTVYEMTGKQLKEYMEWSANYFDTIQPGDTEYRYNAERKKSKYVTYDIFGGVNYKIDLRNPKGSKIVDLTLADGKPVTDDMKLKVGMNSYRFAQLNGKGGIWEGQEIPVLWESKVAMGREKGTIQNMMIDYITNVKKGKIDGQSHNRWEIIGLN
ncbi:5'-nucleotidase, C-terminal domain protein [Haemophilus parainfluenzae ATCC 33392]|uniref:Bifunctional UDP-sugar hydrolase/5'-nucleotidase n=1 Tax=Haemophilus parainfluenzae ATCC 33392 TaxID=888828 RepID=A0ABD7ZJP3_HAEPA|nr:bifunctional UDP-sugar hydrolase/5'-nucleotidase [Haemophilus parainfluenzae]EGC73234.1 5'-nucleotidase, C-terminal domain protein [Haemophilus parainfluenzae ATCC 33392]KFM00138.1 5'-nucleotidase, C-terminal domain protein [Haemophilus parainfluenzae ATCC 33392]QQB22730.1 bifunctional metallophosphatase/5'-nucleotidase [Haemophilus parainfluenzae]WMS24383.1 bifunctional UDP-sugar hydrolase/5'-nucleotidase [Haemophilus parainfluenzae ATCC 33392]STO94903.1 Trifunctional nucleotide phosphoest